jgi:RNA-directed DNA polymerase
MDSLTGFSDEAAKLKVNSEKSAVDRPWNRKILGYSMTHHHKAKLKVAKEAVRRFREKLRGVFRRGRGQNLGKVIDSLTPVLRGWANYFALSEVRNVFDELDSWIRRKLRGSSGCNGSGTTLELGI